MRNLGHKRQLSAWILLGVFIPMLLFASLHTHKQEQGMTTTECYACLHHIHHNSHLTSNTFSIDHCVLCTFLALPYVAGITLAIFAVSGLAFSLGYKSSYTLCLRKQRAYSLRAPPMR
ncbi:MAG: hypothetical protein ACFN41_04630 [Hallella multisaccharivorax]|nr:hypothetical protein [Hallella multisaccharivorax]